MPGRGASPTLPPRSTLAAPPVPHTCSGPAPAPQPGAHCGFEPHDAQRVTPCLVRMVGGKKGVGAGQHSPESWQHHTLPAWSWQNQPLLLFCSPSSEHHAGKQSSQCWGGSPELMSSWNCKKAANCHCHTGTSGGSCCGWPVMGEGAQTGGKALC